MSIHQTKDGRWFAAYRLENDRRVKRKYFGRGVEGKVAAKKWEAGWLEGQITEPLPVVDQGLTFSQLAQALPGHSFIGPPES